jgi:hypothetical protein
MTATEAPPSIAGEVPDAGAATTKALVPEFFTNMMLLEDAGKVKVMTLVAVDTTPMSLRVRD